MFRFNEKPSGGQAAKFTEYKINNSAFRKILFGFFRSVWIVSFEE
jgi:hypothetical protein